MKFRLYPFQKKAIENLLEFTANNKDMGWYLVKSPTGSGKTYIGLIFLYEMFLKKPSSNYHFYCWTRVGSHQINKVLNELIKLDEVSREFAQQLKISLIHNFESIELISDNKIVAVVDEAHHLTEEGAHRNKLIKSPNIQYLIGLTGTPRTTFENDGFSKCYIIERSDMFISLPLMVQITINLPSAESIKKEFGIGQKHIDNTKEVSDLLDNISSSGLTKESKSAYKIKFVASTISKQKNLGKTIVFTRLVAEAEMLSKELTKYGFRVLQINGDISDSHLQIYLHQFKISNDLILIGDKMINESLDIPMINTIILVDQTGSDMLYSQWLGRGSRISKDARRSFFNLIDFRENFDTHNEKEINGGFYNGSRGRK
jgi:superfamily II DNA or RNA helicase